MNSIMPSSLILTNDNLSSDGFVLGPDLENLAQREPFGVELCTEKYLSISRAPQFVGWLNDLHSFGNGRDIDVHGIRIKSSGSDIVILPFELAPFVDFVVQCIQFDYSIDSDARNREYALTVTRSDVKAGQFHRVISGADKFHSHAPSNRTDHRARIPATRTFSSADNMGTDCYVGPRVDPANIRSENVLRIADGAIGVIDTSCQHRTARFDADGRRTVALMNSRSSKSGEPSFANPMMGKLLSVNDKPQARAALLAQWNENYQSLLTNGASIASSFGPPSPFWYRRLPAGLVI